MSSSPPQRLQQREAKLVIDVCRSNARDRGRLQLHSTGQQSCMCTRRGLACTPCMQQQLLSHLAARLAAASQQASLSPDAPPQGQAGGWLGLGGMRQHCPRSQGSVHQQARPQACWRLAGSEPRPLRSSAGPRPPRPPADPAGMQGGGRQPQWLQKGGWLGSVQGCSLSITGMLAGQTRLRQRDQGGADRLQKGARLHQRIYFLGRPGIGHEVHNGLQTVRTRGHSVSSSCVMML